MPDLKRIMSERRRRQRRYNRGAYVESLTRPEAYIRGTASWAAQRAKDLGIFVAESGFLEHRFMRVDRIAIRPSYPERSSREDRVLGRRPNDRAPLGEAWRAAYAGQECPGPSMTADGGETPDADGPGQADASNLPS